MYRLYLSLELWVVAFCEKQVDVKQIMYLHDEIMLSTITIITLYAPRFCFMNIDHPD